MILRNIGMNKYNYDYLIVQLYRCCFREGVSNSDYKFNYLIQTLIRFKLIEFDNLCLQKIYNSFRPLNISIPRYDTDYKEIQKIGSGGFGNVYLSRYYLDNQQYAIKKIILQDKSFEELKKIVSEIEIISKLNHPNIIRYHYSWIEPILTNNRRKLSMKLLTYDGEQLTRSDSDSLLYSSNNQNFCSSNNEIVSIKKHIKGLNINTNFVFYIKMELCQKGTLENLLEQRKSINYQQVFSIINQIINGVTYLHQQSIIHRDLKPSNIFIDEYNNLKIGDFGLSVFDYEYRPISEYEGSELYLDKHHQKSQKFSDIFSIGIIMIELLYIFKTSMERIITLSDLTVEVLKKLFKNDVIVNIIFNCIRDDYNKRFNIHQLHRIIQEFISSQSLSF